MATEGINNSANAAELAARILALVDAEVRLRLNQYLEEQMAKQCDSRSFSRAKNGAISSKNLSRGLHIY